MATGTHALTYGPRMMACRDSAPSEAETSGWVFTTTSGSSAPASAAAASAVATIALEGRTMVRVVLKSLLKPHAARAASTTPAGVSSLEVA